MVLMVNFVQEWSRRSHKFVFLLYFFYSIHFSFSFAVKLLMCRNSVYNETPNPGYLAKKALMFLFFRFFLRKKRTQNETTWIDGRPFVWICLSLSMFRINFEQNRKLSQILTLFFYLSALLCQTVSVLEFNAGEKKRHLNLICMKVGKSPSNLMDSDWDDVLRKEFDKSMP